MDMLNYRDAILVTLSLMVQGINILRIIVNI